MAAQEDDGPTHADDAQQAAQLDSVTDRVAEEEHDVTDPDAVQKALGAIAASRKADQAAKQLRDKELAAVSINKEDIGVIAREFEISEKVAERRLRESGGDLYEALKSFL